MRLRLAYLLAFAAVPVIGGGGCSSSTPDPCGNVTGACVSARVEGTAKGLDQLRFTIVDPAKATIDTPPVPAAPFSLPVKVGIVPPSGAPSSFALLIEGLTGGASVASDHKLVMLTNNRAEVTFTLNTDTGLDLALPAELPDLTVPPDLMSPPPIVITASPAPATVAELDTLTLTVTATDPTKQTVTMALTAQPDGGVVNGTGATQILQWTPDYTTAGQTHTVTATATGLPASRSVMQQIAITVSNVVDEVFNLNPADMTGAGAPPTDSIGDFDGDGKADLASCSVTAGGVYTIFVLFGDSSGLPNAVPLPMSRVNMYTFNSSTGTSVDNLRLRCTGADMDGDGLSDIIISDPGTNGGKGMIYIYYGIARNGGMSTFTQAMPAANLTAGEVLGSTPVFVGHYQSNGKADFATQTFPSSGANLDMIYIFTGKTTRPVTAAFETPESHGGGLVPCGKRNIIGFGDTDMNGLDELMVQDVNQGGTGCTATTEKGGVQLIASSGTVTTIIKPSPAPIGYGFPSTLCDVDGDGKADFVVPDGQPNGKALIYLSPLPLVGATMELDITKAVPVNAAPANHLYSDAHCVKNFYFGAPATLLLVDPGDASTSARVDLVQGAGGMIRGTLPDPVPLDKKFGIIYAGTGDFDGDGKNDVVTGAPMGRFWAIFGR